MRRRNGVVPLAEKFVGVQMDASHLLAGYLHLLRIPFGVQHATHLEFRRGAGVGDEVDDGGMGQETGWKLVENWWLSLIIVKW